MTASASLSKHSVEETHRLTLSLDLDMDITDDDLKLTVPLPAFPWPGEWEISVDRHEHELEVEVSWGDGTPEAAYGHRVEVNYGLFWLSGSDVRKLHGDRGTRSAYHSSNLRTLIRGPSAVRVIIAFEEPILDYASRLRNVQSEKLAERIQGLHLEQLPHDVRLFFPHAHTNGAELWAKSDFLSRSSPYLKDLLSSDFAESKPRRSKRARTSGAGAVEIAAVNGEEKDYPDSDDETDAFLFSKKPPKLEQSTEADEVSYRQVNITQTAFSTYHAILVYLHTGFVHFAPLCSSFPSADSTSPRNDFLAKSRNDKPSLPLPVSPKSAYRLAHLLQLEDLQKRSLDALRSSLSSSDAAVELFSPTAIAYDELRKVILEYVKENWKEVQKSDGWKEKMGELKKREGTAEMAAVMAEVLETVADS